MYETLFYLLLILVIVAVIQNLTQKKKAISRAEEKLKNEITDMPYKDKYILTKNEYAFYKKLREVAEEKQYIICPKVGLKDIFEITKKENYMAYFGRIAQKHIDFLICDKDLKPLYAIELNDSSHANEKRKESDDFKQRLFEKSKIKFIQLKAYPEYSKEYIENALQ